VNVLTSSQHSYANNRRAVSSVVADQDWSSVSVLLLFAGRGGDGRQQEKKREIATPLFFLSQFFLACVFDQGCQMVCFQTRNPNLGKFWRVSQWKMMVYFMETWSLLQSFVIFCGHLV
jgi:hypothetical protein